MMSAVLNGLVVFAMLGAGEGIDWLSRRANRVDLNVTHGHSRPRGMFLTMGIAAVLFALAFVPFAFSWAELQSNWLLLTAVVVFILSFGAYSIRAWLVRRWEWDATGITYFSGVRVTRIPWAGITQAKWVIGGWRITGPNGSVSCSYEMIGYDIISDALIHYRPDLAHITLLRS